MHASKIHIMVTIASYQPKVRMLVGATMHSYSKGILSMGQPYYTLLCDMS